MEGIMEDTPAVNDGQLAPRQLAPGPRQLALVRVWSETTRPFLQRQLALHLFALFYKDISP